VKTDTENKLGKKEIPKKKKEDEDDEKVTFRQGDQIGRIFVY
jgi:hypothetical protein